MKKHEKQKKSAYSALAGAGYFRLNQLTEASEMDPKAISQLHQSLGLWKLYNTIFG
ncbi:hypothetical protein [Seinonella peptonophila]|uniref:hypothetical protein n=1 Tax=Seinonella peptonophila TaxID=112248 RepID=UPI001587E573|nr:hypothetical protein [Seinonella peptonophila]